MLANISKRFLIIQHQFKRFATSDVEFGKAQLIKKKIRVSSSGDSSNEAEFAKRASFKRILFQSEFNGGTSTANGAYKQTDYKKELST